MYNVKEFEYIPRESVPMNVKASRDLNPVSGSNIESLTPFYEIFDLLFGSLWPSHTAQFEGIETAM